MNIEKFQFISVIVPSGKHPAAALSCGMFFIKIGASYLGRSYGHEIEMYTVEQGEKRDKRQ